jgi:hypothetical protein
MAIDFPASPVNGQLFDAANGISYRFNTSPAPGIWQIAQNQAFAAVSSDTVPASPVKNQLWYSTTLLQLFIYYDDGNTTQWVPAAPPVSTGALLQEVSAQTGAMATGATVIPADNTIPQITEGDEFMTLAITPKSATSTLYITVVANGSPSVGGYVTAALFQDATANALAVAADSPGIGGGSNITFTHKMTSGTTSSTTFRVRIGLQAAGTYTFNGNGGVALYGGVFASSITIREVL